MTEPTSAQELFKGRHFDQEIIVLCVRWYLPFKLSSRDLVQMMAERDITLNHTTILRWVQRYVPEYGGGGRLCRIRVTLDRAARRGPLP
jgi:transposase-like protein